LAEYLIQDSMLDVRCSMSRDGYALDIGL